MSAPDRGDPAATMQYIENKTYDEIAVGDSAELTRTLKPQDIELFAVMSGDVNPAHVDAEYAKTDMFHGVIAHGMWGGALISAVLGTELPGPGTIFLNQSLKFEAPVGLGRYGHRAGRGDGETGQGPPAAGLHLPQPARQDR